MSISHNLIKTFFPALFVTASVFGLLGCGGEEAIKQLSAEQQFTNGMKKYDNGDYLEAIDEFKVVTLQYQGSIYADEAQFYMGECRFKREEYILAAFEYDLLIRNMPSSKYAAQARIRKAMCYDELSPTSYLDQEYTKKAIDAYQAFLEYFPTDSLASTAEKRIAALNLKLAKKDYENGITYFKLEYYRAAVYYFNLVLDKYFDTQYAEPAFFKKAESLYYGKKYADATATLNKFAAKYPASSLRDDAAKLREDINAGILEAAAQAKKPKKVVTLNSATLSTQQEKK